MVYSIDGNGENRRSITIHRHRIPLPLVSHASNHPLPAGHALEGYRIERPIASGGFSIVYLAYDAQQAPLAIKEYLPQTLALRTTGETELHIPEASQAEFQRGLHSFFEEARVLSTLNNPHVVRVANFFLANGTAYMAMQLERGRTLHQHIHALSGRIASADFLRLFDQLLQGLAVVHGAGLLHLDLKPANIWLRPDNTPVILDFGAARFAVDIGPPAPRAMYTPGYAAPEQYHGNYTLGPWTDIYAVGACMYATLGKIAPPAADERLIDDDLLPARQRFADVYPLRLLIAIDECLRLSPALRPQSAPALCEMLANAGDSGWPAWLRKLRQRL